jgi:hypothetical protein
MLSGGKQASRLVLIGNGYCDSSCLTLLESVVTVLAEDDLASAEEDLASPALPGVRSGCTGA